MKTIEEVCKALRDAQAETGLRLPSNAVILCPDEDHLKSYGGVAVVYCPTIGQWSLGNAHWKLARAFEDMVNG